MINLHVKCQKEAKWKERRRRGRQNESKERWKEEKMEEKG